MLPPRASLNAWTPLATYAFEAGKTSGPGSAVVEGTGRTGDTATVGSLRARMETTSSAKTRPPPKMPRAMFAGLGGAGYSELRWYPIGLGWRHGFALVTQVEGVDAQGQAAPDRWDASDREPPTLRWLAGARQPRFSYPGRYRALLLSFTDLPVPARGTADPWDEGTVMEGPGIPVGMGPGDLPRHRRVMKTFGWMLFTYEYEPEGPAGDARLVEGAPARPDLGREASIPSPARDLGLRRRDAL